MNSQQEKDLKTLRTAGKSFQTAYPYLYLGVCRKADQEEDILYQDIPGTDLSLFIHIDIGDFCGKLKECIADLWNLDKATLFRKVKSNPYTETEVQIIRLMDSMCYFMPELFGMDTAKIPENLAQTMKIRDGEFQTICPAYLARNGHRFGAGCMFQGDTATKTVKLFGPCYMVPSSTDEWLLTPVMSGMKVAELLYMCHEVNANPNAMTDDLLLSNQIYYLSMAGTVAVLTN